jgi:RHS repeat-associated protein
VGRPSCPATGEAIDADGTWNYSYDVFGNRIEEDTFSASTGQTTLTRFAWDTGPLAPGGRGQGEGHVWAELDGTGSLTTRRIYGDNPDQPLARVTVAGVSWYLADRLGSVRVLTDPMGAVQDQLSYDAYGNITAEANPSAGDRLKYAGYFYDFATGLYNAGARWYDASSGRWMSQDPLGFDAGDSNLNRYVGNGPTDATDPTGLAKLVREARPNGRIDLYMARTILWSNNAYRWVTGNQGNIYIGYVDAQEPDRVYREGLVGSLALSFVESAADGGEIPDESQAWFKEQIARNGWEPTSAAALARQWNKESGTGFLTGVQAPDYGMIIDRAKDQAREGMDSIRNEYTIGVMGSVVGGLGGRGRFVPRVSKNPAVEEALEQGGVRVVSRSRAGVARPPRHHIFPQEEREWFKKRGVDVDKWTVQLDEGTHQALHYGAGKDRPGGWWNEQIMAELKNLEGRLGRQLQDTEIEKVGIDLMKRTKIDGLPIVVYRDP